MKAGKELAHCYTNGVIGKKIAVLGPYPPPLGGVAVHVRRVIAKLKKQNNNVRFFDTTAKHRWRFSLYLIKLALFFVRFRPDHIYYNTIYLTNSLPELRLIFFLKKLLRFDVTFIEHNCRHMYKRPEAFKKTLSRLICDQSFIFIGDSTHKSYDESGVVIPQKSSIESAFLPPDQSREQEILATYPASLFYFIQFYRPLIVANAFQLSLLDGKDLYGFDLCVELIHKLKDTHPCVGLVLALANVGDGKLYKKLCDMIDRLQVKKQVYILSDQKELWPILKHANLFVRPTLSDSFGISIAEALQFGTPAIASDVCIRPAGTVLFERGNKKDFFEKVFRVLEKKENACVDKKTCRKNMRLQV